MRGDRLDIEHAEGQLDGADTHDYAEEPCDEDFRARAPRRRLVKYLQKATHAPHANRLAALMPIPRLIL